MNGPLSAPTTIVLDAALPPSEVVPGFEGLPDLRIGQADDSCADRGAETQRHPLFPCPEPSAGRGALGKDGACHGPRASPMGEGADPLLLLGCPFPKRYL